MYRSLYILLILKVILFVHYSRDINKATDDDNFNSKLIIPLLCLIIIISLNIADVLLRQIFVVARICEQPCS